MDCLVLAPPIISPAEPPSGAFVLAAGLAGHGRDVGLLDLSLEFFHRVFDELAPSHGSVPEALSYLRNSPGGYQVERHRSLTGELHRMLSSSCAAASGWKLTLMDVAPPVRVHDPCGLDQLLRQDSPFQDLWSEILWPQIEDLRPKKILISLAYLSQLPATIDLVRFLEARGLAPIVGGSLPRSIARTGHGLELLRKVVARIDLGDGLSQVSGGRAAHLTGRLAWPQLLSTRRYLSSRPIIPLPLSTGCCWHRCRFCPDRELPFVPIPRAAVDDLLRSRPADQTWSRPVLHLLDSALPPRLLRDFLPLAREHELGFYGFARPSAQLLEGGLIDAAAEAGCLMLQLGVESGSESLLANYDKGFDPREAAEVVRATAGAGIRCYAYLLFGLPGERPQDRERTLDLIANAGDDVDFLNVSLFNLPRVCEISEQPERWGIELTDYPDERELIRLYWPFTENGRSPRDDARAFLKRRFDANPRVRAARHRTPRWLRAAHLALMDLPDRRRP